MSSLLPRHTGSISTRLGALFALVALLLPLAACSSDSGGDNANTDTGADTGSDTGSDASAATWEPTLYRVVDLLIDQPASVGTLIGQLVARDIRDGILNILVETGQFDADSGATTFEIRGGAGETADGTTYQLVADIDWVPATVDASGAFENTELLTLDFPVLLRLPPTCDGGACPDNHCRTNDDCVEGYTCDVEGDGECLQNIVLPLKDIRVTGTFEAGEDGTPELNLATLDGAILKVDADQIQVGLPTGTEPLILTNLLNEDNMNYPDRQNPTGWELSALINAVAVPMAE